MDHHAGRKRYPLYQVKMDNTKKISLPPFWAENTVPILLSTAVMSAASYIYSAGSVLAVILFTIVSLGFSLLLFSLYEFLRQKGKTWLTTIVVVLLLITSDMLALRFVDFRSITELSSWVLEPSRFTQVHYGSVFSMILLIGFILISCLYYFTRVRYRKLFLFLICLCPFCLFAKTFTAIPVIYPIVLMTLFFFIMTGNAGKASSDGKEQLIHGMNRGTAVSSLAFVLAVTILASFMPKLEFAPFREQFDEFVTGVTISAAETANFDDFSNNSSGSSSSSDDTVVFYFYGANPKLVKRQCFNIYDGTENTWKYYGNSNDGEWLENGRQNPDGRRNTTVKLTVDGNEQVISLPNTIKSEYTSCFAVPVFQLESGEHKVKLEHIDGTCVMDSLLVSAYNHNTNVSAAVIEDADRTTASVKSFLAVAPYDGYYTVKADAESASVDGAKIAFENGEASLFLKRGLNYIDVASDKKINLSATYVSEEVHPEAQQLFLADSFVLSGGAKLSGKFADGISSLGGSAEITYNAPEAGVYRLTFSYSNNDEGGVHDYNVDLIERYITVSVNASEQGNCFCRNTYSWDTVKTVTFSVELKKGENTVTFSNNGSERFNNQTAFAPHIYCVTVSPAQL